MTLIILQRETGSALVYMAFFLMLYREGMPGVVLFSGICAVVYFVVGIRFDQVFIADTPTPIGEFVVLSMILLFAGGMVWVYKRNGSRFGISSSVLLSYCLSLIWFRNI